MSNRASVIELAVNVPDLAGTPLIAGDLMIVRNVSTVKGNDQKASPFALGRVLIHPNLTAEVQTRRRQLVLTVPLVIRKGPASATLALLRDGRQLAEVPVSLGRPDKDGRLMPLIEFPVVDLPSGEYDVKLRLAGADYSTERSTTVILP
jgi:hypothetical protein